MANEHISEEELIRRCRKKGYNSAQLTMVADALEEQVSPSDIWEIAEGADEKLIPSLLKARTANVEEKLFRFFMNKVTDNCLMEEMILAYQKGMENDDIQAVWTETMTAMEFRELADAYIAVPLKSEGELLEQLEVFQKQIIFLQESIGEQKELLLKVRDAEVKQLSDENKKLKELLEQKELIIKNLQLKKSEKGTDDIKADLALCKEQLLLLGRQDIGKKKYYGRWWKLFRPEKSLADTLMGAGLDASRMEQVFLALEADLPRQDILRLLKCPDVETMKIMRKILQLLIKKEQTGSNKKM